MHTNSATIEIAKPRLFTAGAVAVVSAYGILLATPFLISVLVISVIQFGPLTVLIPLLVVAATAYFLPFGLGNAHVTRLVYSLNPAAAKGEDGFIVQLTLSPRLRTGLRALLEDADDVGYLSFTGTGLRFQGDSVKLTVPFDCIQEVRPQNIGLRGLFVYGRRIRLVVSGLPQAEAIEFAERSSRVLPASRAITRKLYQRLSTKAPLETKQGGASGASL
ncbi:MAG: hypothetical protein ACLQU3_07870 [Limisphaerales bacterium]